MPLKICTVLLAASGFTILALASTGHAQPQYQPTSKRAVAINECCSRAARYNQYTWGDMDIQQYRACMSGRGQAE